MIRKSLGELREEMRGVARGERRASAIGRAAAALATTGSQVEARAGEEPSPRSDLP
jgi:hypothetical protein